MFSRGPQGRAGVLVSLFISPAERYLRLASNYRDARGGLRWSSQADALEYEDGTTFAFTEEIALFVEGFASSGRLVHFGYLLQLLHITRNGDGVDFAGRARLRRAFVATGRPLRNAGAFFAELCRDIPEVSGGVRVVGVLDLLRNPARPMRFHHRQL